MTRLWPLVMLMLSAGAALAQDHPLVPAFHGSEVIRRNARPDDSYRLLVHPLENPSSSSAEHRQTYLTVTGNLTRIAYQAPRGEPVSEVFHYYERTLQGEGFEILYNCAGQSCSPSTGGAAFNEAMSPGDLGERMHGRVRSQRYLAAKLPRAEGDVWVSLYATRTDLSAETKDDAVFCDVVVVDSPTHSPD